MCTRLFVAVTSLAVLTSTAAAQSTPPGPTMDDTRQWLETEGRELMRSLKLEKNPGQTSFRTIRSEIDTISLTDCTLSWREVETSQTTAATRAGMVQRPPTTKTVDVTLVLAETNAGAIGVQSSTLNTEDPVYEVRLPIRDPARATSMMLTNSLDTAVLRAGSLPVQTAEDGQRVANAVKRAAQLCN